MHGYLSVPSCAKNVIKSFLEMTEASIEYYLLFMQGKDDSIVDEQITKAKSSQRFFITSYSLFKQGKSTNTVEVYNQITEDLKKDVEEINKQLGIESK